MPTIPGADATPAALLIAGISFIVLGAIRGDWVPGWIYKAAIARAEKAEALLELALQNVEKVAAAAEKALDDRNGT